MTFAKVYREEITLAYYCFNCALTIAIFVFGTIYLRYRDRTDQKRKEWRQFAETIRNDYSKLNAKCILQRISHINKTFENIRIYKEITGIHILRFMINAERSSFRTVELHSLLEDLGSIYQLLNTCASLTLLGTVPPNIRDGLGKLIVELGELTLPLYSGEERATILKCLEHFGCGRRRQFEKKEKQIERTIEGDVPYVRCLEFGEGTEYRGLRGCGNYEDVKRFNANFCGRVLKPAEPLNFLIQLDSDLEREDYRSEFVSELREQAANLTFLDKISSDDEDELVLMKALHEIRVYIHLAAQQRKPLDKEMNSNMDLLRGIHEQVTRIKPDQLIVKETCVRFMQDLNFLRANMQRYHKSKGFSLQLQQLYETFCDLIVIRKGDDVKPPPVTTRKNDGVRPHSRPGRDGKTAAICKFRVNH